MSRIYNLHFIFKEIFQLRNSLNPKYQIHRQATKQLYNIKLRFRLNHFAANFLNRLLTLMQYQGKESLIVRAL